MGNPIISDPQELEGNTASTEQEQNENNQQDSLELKTSQQKSVQWNDYEDKVENLPESKAVRPKGLNHQEKKIRKLEDPIKDVIVHILEAP